MVSSPTFIDIPAEGGKFNVELSIDPTVARGIFNSLCSINSGDRVDYVYDRRDYQNKIIIN